MLKQITNIDQNTDFFTKLHLSFFLDLLKLSSQTKNSEPITSFYHLLFAIMFKD